MVVLFLKVLVLRVMLKNLILKIKEATKVLDFGNVLGCGVTLKTLHKKGS
ncbi:MAG: hypothetical protein LBL77_03345 [Endomicrobium sp.]|jgi:hypothetical protein|nr:hypothetical protein [Endomicrobium sp.]